MLGNQRSKWRLHNHTHSVYYSRSTTDNFYGQAVRRGKGQNLEGAASLPVILNLLNRIEKGEDPLNASFNLIS